MEKKIEQNYKPAYIEQALMWMVIFIGFVWMFFFVIDYATAFRVKDNMDDLSKYGAKFVARYSNQATVANEALLYTNLNNMNIDVINDIAVGDINCVIDAATLNSQSIFIVQGTYVVSDKIPTSDFSSKSVVFNETSQAEITCTLNLTFN